MVSALVPHPRNPNTHSTAQIELLAKIIAGQGWRAPIVVSKDSGFVVSGHARLKAAERLGLDSVPVNLQPFKTQADEWAHLVADNRIAELAEMDNKLLKDLLSDMDTGAVDMDLTGYDNAALEDLMTQCHVEDNPEVRFSESILESHNYIVLLFENDIDWISAQTHFNLETVKGKRMNGKPWNKGIGRVINGAAYLMKTTKDAAGT